MGKGGGLASAGKVCVEPSAVEAHGFLTVASALFDNCTCEIGEIKLVFSFTSSGVEMDNYLTERHGASKPVLHLS